MEQNETIDPDQTFEFTMANSQENFDLLNAMDLKWFLGDEDTHAVVVHFYRQEDMQFAAQSLIPPTQRSKVCGVPTPRSLGAPRE